jgi:hypothetical protein
MGASPFGSIPPGLEHLSEEERMKIMAVMACAEIDAQEPAPQAQIATKSVEPVRSVSTSGFDGRTEKPVEPFKQSVQEKKKEER